MCQTRDEHGNAAINSWIVAPDVSPEGLANLVCPNCGAFVTIYGFLRDGQRLPEGAFSKHPAWRLAWYAVHGGPKEMLPYVRHNLRWPQMLRHVNIVRGWLGYDALTEELLAEGNDDVPTRKPLAPDLQSWMDRLRGTAARRAA